MVSPLWIKLLLAFWRTSSCCCFLVLSFAPDVMLGFLPCASFMGPSSSTLVFHQKTNPKQTWHSSSSLFMVRNIDLPECLLFYGVSERFFAHYDTDGSLTSLLQECADVDTAVVVIPDTQEVDTDKLSNTLASFPVPMTLIPPTHPPRPQSTRFVLRSSWLGNSTPPLWRIGRLWGQTIRRSPAKSLARPDGGGVSFARPKPRGPVQWDACRGRATTSSRTRTAA